ncbi:asparagine--tRNA ligase [Desulfothermus okinawensis JCM 13304]
MKEKKTIRNIFKSDKEILNIEINGWVRTRRDSKGFSFLEVNDGSCLKNLQVVIDHSVVSAGDLKRMTTGCSVKIVGDVVESPGKKQKWEVVGKEVYILGEADPLIYPLQKKRHSDEFLRQIAHLRVRTNKYGAINRIRSTAAYLIHKFLQEKDFFYIHTPIITSSDCEGAGELFQVIKKGEKKDTFFKKDAYLTVSGQLTAEAICLGLGRVYTFGPTFRAEDSNTPRHAAEFWMVEPEMAFFDLDDDIDLAEELIKYVVKGVLETRLDDIELFSRFLDKDLKPRLEKVICEPFRRIEYSEAISVLSEADKRVHFQFQPKWGEDLQTEHEKYLTEIYFKGPVVVYNYPKEIKPFYMRLNDDNKTVAAMDILLPKVGEVVGGSQREERLDVLIENMNRLGINRDDYEWYLDLRRYGTAPHSGFGLGFDRLVMFLTSVSNIRDVIPFPRTPGTLNF